MADEEPKSKVAKLDDEENNTDTVKPESKEVSSPFSSQWHHSDVVMDIEGRKFHVHKCLLSISSPAFAKMFTPGFKEEKAEEIPLPNKKADEMEALFKLIYGNKVAEQEVSDDNFEFLLKLADEYEIEEVKKLCADFMATNVHKDNCLHYYLLAEKFHLEKVYVAKYMEMVKLLPITTIENSEYFVEISLEEQLQIFLDKIKVLEKKVEDAEKVSPICLKLVKDIFHAADKRSRYPSTECDSLHHSRESRNKFVFDCPYCIERLKENWPASSTYSQFPDPSLVVPNLWKLYPLIKN